MTTDRFHMELPFEPTGDQPEAIQALAEGVRGGERWQTLLGVTGSCKTVTMAGVIQETGLPTLVMSGTTLTGVRSTRTCDGCKRVL